MLSVSATDNAQISADKISATFLHICQSTVRGSMGGNRPASVYADAKQNSNRSDTKVRRSCARPSRLASSEEGRDVEEDTPQAGEGRL